MVQVAAFTATYPSTITRRQLAKQVWRKCRSHATDPGQNQSHRTAYQRQLSCMLLAQLVLDELAHLCDKCATGDAHNFVLLVCTVACCPVVAALHLTGTSPNLCTNDKSIQERII